jgi:uncharacterized alkaline shock family protein YloU
MDQEFNNEFGKITISKEVISIIAGLAAMECYGLVGMSSQRVQDGIADFLGKNNLRKGIEVDIKKGSVIVDLYVVIEYGINISEVASNIIDKVKYTLEEYSGVEVAEININIQGVRVGEAEQ